MFSITSAPELSDYPLPVRRVVVRRASALMTRDTRFASWLPTLFSFGGGFAGAGLLVYGRIDSWPLPGRSPSDPLGPTILWGFFVALCALLGGFLGLQLQLRKLRPYLRLAVDQYVAETFSVAAGDE
jgi:hypothetical protein